MLPPLLEFLLYKFFSYVLGSCSKDYNMYLTKIYFRDFPGGPMVKNPPSNARDAGSIPGWGTKIPHAVGQLSPCATTTETMRHN